MGAVISATMYATFSLILAYLLKVRVPYEHLSKQFYIAWFLLAVIGFFLADALIIFMLGGAILILMSPKITSERIAFFVILLPAVPDFHKAPLPFPGLNYLLEFEHWKIVVLIVLLIPMLLKRKSSIYMEPNPVKVQWNFIDVVVIVYVVYIALMTYRTLPFTSSLRIFIDYFLLLIVPYFFISRRVTDSEKLEKIIYAFLCLAILLGCISVFSQIKRWDFYKLFLPDTAFSIYEIRYGLLRVGGPISTGTFGILCAIGLICLDYFRNKFGLTLFKRVAITAILVLGILSSGSRGVLLFCIVIYLVYFFLRANKKVRLHILVLCVAGVAVYPFLGQVLSFDSLDEHGTFDYRYRLLLASFKQIGEHPFWGDANFLQSGNFDHLVQGQGIVDIVNTYLQITLQYGLVGLVMFVSMYLFCIIPLYKKCVSSSLSQDKDPEFINEVRGPALILAVTIGYLVMIMTVSNVSLNPHYGVIFLALIRGLGARKV